MTIADLRALHAEATSGHWANHSDCQDPRCVVLAAVPGLLDRIEQLEAADA